MVLVKNKEDMGWRKWLIAGWAFLECLFFSGIVFGWGSLVFIFKAEGIYSDLCPENRLVSDCLQNQTTGATGSVGCGQSDGRIDVNTSGSLSITDASNVGQDATRRQCDAQDSKMTLCFTIAVALTCTVSVVFGQITYKYGTRVTRLLAFLLYVSGSLCTAFISTDIPWLMFPGMSLIGVGGLSLMVTNIQVANLFVVGSSTVVGLISGAYDMSSAVMLMIKIAYENGYSRQNMFLLITLLHTLVLISTFLFLPKDFIPKREQKDMTIVVSVDTAVTVATVSNGIDKSNDTTKQEEHPEKPRESETQKPQLKHFLGSTVFTLQNIWVYFLALRFFCFIGTLNSYLNRSLNGDEDKVSYFTNVCYTVMMGGLISSFFSGFMYDFVRKACAEGKSKAFREMLPPAVPIATTSLLGVVLSILVLVPSEGVLYATFVTLTVMRSFLYAMMSAFICALYPIEYFGLLYGITQAGAGMFGFLQYAVFKWAESYVNAHVHANLFLLVLSVLSFVQPLYLVISALRSEKKAKVFTQDPTI